MAGAIGLCSSGPMIPTVAILMLVASTECTDRDRYTLHVERARPGAVEGLEVEVEAGGPTGVRLAADSVRGGVVRVCITGASPGEMVDVRLGSRTFRLLYPPGGRVPITHQGAPSIVVCEVDRDCEVSRQEASNLIGLARPAAITLTAADKESFFQMWRHSLEVQGMHGGHFVEALKRKERQIGASRLASELLSRFVTRAKEVVDRFRRHGPDALDYPNAGPSAQIDEATARYRPVSDEIKRSGASYRKAISDSASEARSVEFQRLLDEALAIHQEIQALDELAQLITACRNHGASCGDRTAARVRILDGVDRICADAGARLNRFEQREGAFLGAMNDDLFATSPQEAGGQAADALRERRAKSLP